MKILAAVVAATTLSMASTASAVIVNIDATSMAGTNFTFGTGVYEVRWIGIAEGGAYDSAFVDCVGNPSGCTPGYTNAINVIDNPVQDPARFDVDVFQTRAVYATAAESLLAYQTGTVFHDFVEIVNGVQGTPSSEGPIPRPLLYSANGESFTFRVLDGTFGSRAGNSGGVSLDISRVAVVPEPATWAMMIAGFGFAGAALRGRRRRGLLAAQIV
jgi:hypothetical protein